MTARGIAMRFIASIIVVALSASHSYCAEPESKTKAEPESQKESPNDKSKPVMIPLDQIWAYEMPRTRDVRKLEPKLDVYDPAFKEIYERSRVRQIATFLATHVREPGHDAEPAFIVAGIGKEALKNAHTSFIKERLAHRTQLAPPDVELSLVFYTYVTGWHPRIESVEMSPRLITVKYRFIAPEEPSFGAVRFALIPIGKQSPGTVEVKIEQLPPVDYRGRPMPPKRNAERFVCGSFEFEVKEK